MSLYVCMWGYICMSMSTCRCQKKVLDLLELELLAFVSYPLYVLGIELCYSANTARDLNETALTCMFLRDVLLFLILCVCMCFCVGICIWVQMSLKAWGIGCNCSHRWLWASWCRCWKPNLGPPEDYYLILTASPSSILYFWY